MAGRGRMQPPMLPAHGTLPGTGVFGPGVRPIGAVGRDVILPPSPAIIEEKLAAQHAEIQRLLTENQRLAATHVALRQEFAAAQQEIQRLQQRLGGVQAEKEQQFRGLAEKSVKMEAELRALEPLKADLQRAQADAQKLLASRQELTLQVQQLNEELLKYRTDSQQFPSMKGEIESLRHEIQRARTAFEFEKKANTDLLEQRSAMEKNLVSMAREVEKLRADLTNAEKKIRGTGYGGAYGSESGYTSYGDGYGMKQSQVGAASVENSVPYAGKVVPSWGSYGGSIHR